VPASDAPRSTGTVSSRGRLALIEAGGNFSRRIGLPRTLGQIYGLLFLSPRALSLEEIAGQLDISKASVSTGARQLASWGAIRQVWIPGSRKDFFEAIPELGALIRSAYREFFKPRLDASQKRGEVLIETLRDDCDQGRISQEDFEFCRGRLQTLGRFQTALQSVAPLLDRVL
jgi:HTH-type transcriptional regulator, glycine betaine synthesis regulator